MWLGITSQALQRALHIEGGQYAKNSVRPPGGGHLHGERIQAFSSGYNARMQVEMMLF